MVGFLAGHYCSLIYGLPLRYLFTFETFVDLGFLISFFNRLR